MTGYSIQQIAAALGTDVLGDGSIIVTGVAEPGQAGPDDLAMAMSARYAAGLAQGMARAAVIGAGMDWQALGLQAAIVAPRPRVAMAHVTRTLDPGPVIATGHSPDQRDRSDRKDRGRGRHRPFRRDRPGRADRRASPHRKPCLHRRRSPDRR
jgi:UDP-3-O-[3-hydroxymyristoyl] glucosamine N-acyltransferase